MPSTAAASAPPDPYPAAKVIHVGESPSTATPQSRSRRRRLCRCCLITTLILIVLLVVAAVVIYFTLLRVKQPTEELVSVRVTGVAPRVSFPAMTLQLNLTLDLAVRVHNPNHASFSHGDGGITKLYYRGTQVGAAAVEPGTIPSEGDGMVYLSMTVEADRFLGKLGDVIGDVAAGEIGLDAVTTVPGRVDVLGIFKLNAVAESTCHIAVGVPDFAVRRQDCDNTAKL